MELEVSPYWVCPCKGQGKKITAVAAATGEGASDVSVIIIGPHGTSASGIGRATLEYTTTDADRGTELQFSATATDRPDRDESAYAIMSKFVSFQITKGKIDLADDPEFPGFITLTAVNDEMNIGIEMNAEFIVIPFVPETDNPTKSIFLTCPIRFQIEQWVHGSQVTMLSTGNPPNVVTNKLETLHLGTPDPYWDQATQSLKFTVVDVIGPRTNAPLNQIQLMSIQAKANVYLETKCRDCTKFEPIGKATWEINGAVAPAPPPPSQPLLAGGTLTPTAGIPSNEEPAQPNW